MLFHGFCQKIFQKNLTLSKGGDKHSYRRNGAGKKVRHELPDSSENQQLGTFVMQRSLTRNDLVLMTNRRQLKE
jgi:hypothetical protein